MLAEKKPLTLEDVEAQSALELPDREMLALVNVIVGNVTVQAPIGIAAAVCPNVNAAVLAQEVSQTGEATCEADASAAADNRAFQNFVNRGTL